MGQQGVLVIGHGSHRADWVRLVEQAVEGMKTPLPVFTSFLELVPGRSIADGLRYFERLNASDVVAIPLFVSSGSSHIDEIRCMLGVGPRLPFMAEDVQPIPHRLKIFFREPMDAHPLIVQVLLQRLQRLSVDPRRERVLLVSHGSEAEGLRQRNEVVLTRLARRLQEASGVASVGFATHLPDTIRLRALEEAHKAGDLGQRLIVLPLFLSEGHFTQDVLPAELAGLEYTYSGETYLPHPNVSQWLDLQVVPRTSVTEGVLS